VFALALPSRNFQGALGKGLCQLKALQSNPIHKSIVAVKGALWEPLEGLKCQRLHASEWDAAIWIRG
jgi:hypothetical protein